MKRTAITALLALVSIIPASAQTRVKDVARVQGSRSNFLRGVGVVIGLDGSGDSNQAVFTPQALANILQRMGLSVPPGTLKVRNVALVMVTAELPPFGKVGSNIDVTVNSIGDAKSLQGGTLLETMLNGVDGQTYALAQGPLSIGGFNFSAGGASAQKNHVTVGRVPRGGVIEREVKTSLTDGNSLQLTLRDPDFTTASRIADAVNSKVQGANALAEDPYSVKITLNSKGRDNLIGFISEIEALTITTDTAAKVVVNERTGTVVIGGDVRIKSCAITHGALQIKVDNTPVVAIPAPFSGNGQPVIVPQKDVTVNEQKPKMAALPATTSVDQLVKALNALGVTPRDMIAILQVMKQGGHLNAEIEIQ